MSFIADKQTLEDLNILGKYKANSMFKLFNRVLTAGGERLLETMFKEPLTDAVLINERSRIFERFQHLELTFPFDREKFSVMENYLFGEAAESILATGIDTFKKWALGMAVKDEEYQQLLDGIMATITIINSCKDFMDQLKGFDLSYAYQRRMQSLDLIFRQEQLLVLKDMDDVTKLTLIKVIRYEHLFRQELKLEMKKLLDFIYYLDVCIAVAAVAKNRGFTYAAALPKESNVFSAKELRHPALEKAIGNEVSFQQESNLLFLTGANMAGKSTFMKSFGVSMYLAHMGFPVAAKQMVFSLRDGIYSSINVPDNLNMGLSHFYAEVLRVKTVAEEVSAGNDLLVIFDELFKGTNVKDAYDATLAVTKAFSDYRNCLYIISTHIIEVGEALKEDGTHIQFKYLPTVMKDNVPQYTYKLETGITTDRQGMTIIENEGILEIITGKSDRQTKFSEHNYNF